MTNEELQEKLNSLKNKLSKANQNKDKKHFCIFDELYSGTNPSDAVDSAYSFLNYLTKFGNINFILTTHYVDLCEKLNSNKNIEQIITAPMLAFIERVEHKQRDKMIDTARKGMKERQIEEQVGIRKSPDWLKERTEKHLQKVRNVSS